MHATHGRRLARLTPALPALLLALGLGQAQAIEVTQVQADRSKVSFTFKQMGVPVTGAFAGATGTLRFDPAHPETATARIAIDLAGIDAGSQEANDEVVGKQWLNVKAFPTAEFVASRVEARGNGYAAIGKLTIKGTTRDLTAPFSFKSEGTTGVFDGAFVFKRLDFGIGEGIWSDVDTVANEIEIKFHVVATGTPAADQ